MISMQYIARPSLPQDKHRLQIEHRLFNLILDMAEKGRGEFKRGLTMAVNEWKELGVLQGDALASPSGITENDMKDPTCCSDQLPPNKEISLRIMQALRGLIMTDGHGKHHNGSIKIDLLSYKWYESSMKLAGSRLTAPLRKRPDHPDESHLVLLPGNKRRRTTSILLFGASAMKGENTVMEGMFDKMNAVEQHSSFVRHR